MLEGAATSADSARERLFDTLMRRFDALKPHRDAVRAIARDSVARPAALLGMPILRRSMGWMLEASGISSAGCRGHLLSHLLAGLYLSVLRVFLDDDSPDLARTMAALDRGLKRGETLCRALPSRRREAASPAA